MASDFENILAASGEDLLKILYKASQHATSASASANPARRLARQLGLTTKQLLCAVGFNRNIRDLPDVAAILGFASYDELAHRRNKVFTNDVYKDLKVRDVLAIYSNAKPDLQLLEIMQHLMRTRLQKIETRIDETVNSVFIERYKKEIRAIYGDGIAQVDFAEHRLQQTESGFRALLNEVGIIVEQRLIPIGDIFFRNTVLPEEKRRLIRNGLVPQALVEARLKDADVPPAERAMLEDQLRYF
jgi:hypothetical protein